MEYEERTTLKAFLRGEDNVALLPTASTRLQLNPTEYLSSPQAGDTRLMSPLAPIGSCELWLLGETGGKNPIFCELECERQTFCPITFQVFAQPVEYPGCLEARWLRSLALWLLLSRFHAITAHFVLLNVRFQSINRTFHCNRSIHAFLPFFSMFC